MPGRTTKEEIVEFASRAKIGGTPPARVRALGCSRPRHPARPSHATPATDARSYVTERACILERWQSRWRRSARERWSRPDTHDKSSPSSYLISLEFSNTGLEIPGMEDHKVLGHYTSGRCYFCNAYCSTSSSNLSKAASIVCSPG